MPPPPNNFQQSADGGFYGHALFSLENIYRAYRRCRRRKRGTINALIFEQNLEENIVSLHEELTAGTYCPGPSLAFLVEKPKRREIFAADFRDRVVHHLLVGHLEPAWERRFIHDSYACRKGRGTHKGVERLRSFTRKVTANGTRGAWYLQLDVQGFFVMLDRQILYRRLLAYESDPAVRWLIQVILFREPAGDCRFRSAKRGVFENLPAHKTLFKARNGCGLPIGNLTSQFFANVYLDALDQFIKRGLSVKYYVRYCDDMVLLSANKEELEEWEERIKAFLADRLRLQLNERRRLRPVSDGIDFLGYIVRPDYLLVRRRVVRSFRERLNKAEQTLVSLGMAIHVDGRSLFPWHRPVIDEVPQWLNSYLSHIRKASSHRLITALRNRFWWLEEYFIWEAGKVGLRYPVPRFALRFWQQKKWFKTRLPGHVRMIQKGGFWEMDVQTSGTGLRRSQWPERIHRRGLARVKTKLWKANVPVAWIAETGRRLDRIAERALVCRWACTQA